MEITLNHTIVPAHDHVASAKFYAQIFDFEYLKEWGHFAVVRVNATLTLDFQVQQRFSSQHYAFKVNESQFDEIFGRIRTEGLTFGSGPTSLEDGEINHNFGGRGVYFKDPNNHVLELMTTDYIID